MLAMPTLYAAAAFDFKMSRQQRRRNNYCLRAFTLPPLIICRSLRFDVAAAAFFRLITD